MEYLYNRKETKKIIYQFTINQGGEENIRVSNGSDRLVEIYFINDKFDHCNVEITPEFNERSYWIIMGAIGQKIKQLESEISNNKRNNNG